MNTIDRVRIRGFRSLADVELADLPNATVLIGANGSGKSNFIRFFEMMSWMLRSRRLAEFVARQGGADDQLFGGHRTTPRIEAELSIRSDCGMHDYRFSLAYAEPDRLFFAEEAFRYAPDHCPPQPPWERLGDSHREAEIVHVAQSGKYSKAQAAAARGIVSPLRNCAVYQFHDTSDKSKFKTSGDVHDSFHLRSDGGNLAAVLLWLEREDAHRFDLICEHVRRILPDFDRFHLRERYGKVLLGWKAKGTDKIIGAHLTSDGSLRFFALVTLLNLPVEMLSDVLFLDEPELGLHPFAIGLVGGMIQSLAVDRQIIVATQSPLLVDVFDLDQMIVLELRDGRTDLKRFTNGGYQEWLDDGYTSGDLWQKNLVGGRP